MFMLNRAVRPILLAIAGLAPGLALSQEYPNKTIRIFTAPAGGSADFAARLIAQSIAGPLGQPVVVENRSGLVPVETVAKAPGDGYTLLVHANSMWISPLLRKTSYDPIGDFSPISLLLRQPNVVAVHPSLPVKSIKELIALAKARPGQLNYASAAIGGSTHLGPELFKSMANIAIVHVPYKGAASALNALLSGEAQVLFTNDESLMALVKSGRLRALAVTSAEPSALVPGLPTMAASGLPGYESVNVVVMFAPVKTPDNITKRLNQEAVRTLTRSDVSEKFAQTGTEVVASSPEQLAAAVKADMARMGKVINDAGIKAE